MQATVVLLSVTALFPLMIPYYRAVQEIGVRGWSAIAMLLPRPESYFRAFKGSLVWSWLHDARSGLPLPWEHEIFPGVMPYAGFLAVGYLCLRSRQSSSERAGCIAALNLITLVITTISIKGTSVYRVFVFVPGVGAIQAVTRIMLVLLFLLGLLTGIMVGYIENFLSPKFTRRKKIAILLAVSCVIIFDQYCTDLIATKKKEVQQRTMLLAKKIEVMNQIKNAQVFYYMPERDEKPHVVHLDAMMAAQSVGLGTINGYSGNFPRDYPLVAGWKDQEKLEQWVRYSGVRFSDSYGKLGYRTSTDALLSNVLVVR